MNTGHGGTPVHRGAAPAWRISRKKFFLRPPHVRDIVKEWYFFVPRYEVWGGGGGGVFRICCRHLLPLNRQRIIKSKVKIRVPVHPVSVF